MPDNPNVPPEDSTRVHDGFESLIKGIGSMQRDPVMSERATVTILDDQQLEAAYRGDAISARVVDLLPSEALRQGWGVRVDEMGDGADVDPAQANEINDGLRDYMRKRNANPKIKRGFSMGRLFGGALAIGGFSDTGSDLKALARPVKPGSELRWIIEHDRRVAIPGELISDPSNVDFGKPKHYDVTLLEKGESVRVDASRVIRFGGRWAPSQWSADSNILQGWDDSELLGTWGPLKHFSMTHETTARVARDFSRLVYYIKGLREILEANGDELVRKRFQLMEMCMSVLNAVLMDADGEKLEMMQRPITGLPELLDRFGNLLAAATGYPITLLLGLSPGGFGTGEDEDRRWGNVVVSYQDDVVRPVLERLCTWAFLDPTGPTKGKLPAHWSITFPQPRAPSEKEKAEIRDLVSKAWAACVAAGILLPEEAAEGMFGGSQGFGLDVVLDRDLRKEHAAMELERVEAETEAMLAATRAAPAVGGAPTKPTPGKPAPGKPAPAKPTPTKPAPKKPTPRG